MIIFAVDLTLNLNDVVKLLMLSTVLVTQQLNINNRLLEITNIPKLTEVMKPRLVVNTLNSTLLIDH